MRGLSDVIHHVLLGLGMSPGIALKETTTFSFLVFNWVSFPSQVIHQAERSIHLQRMQPPRHLLLTVPMSPKNATYQKHPPMKYSTVESDGGEATQHSQHWV